MIADSQPNDRDEYAAALRRGIASDYPQEGDRVRVAYRDGSTAEGRWTFAGGDGENWVVAGDARTPHTHVVGRDRIEVLQCAEHPRRALLTEGEGLAVAELLDELAGLYPGEDLGRLARELAGTIYDRFGS